MHTTATTLRRTADTLTTRGLWTGPHFTGPDGTPSITAAIYLAIYGTLPAVFATDDDLALLVLRGDTQAMDAIRALSAALPTEPPATDGTDDHIEHLEAWASTPAIGDTNPPSTSEVIGRILRTADTLAPTQHAA